MLKDFLRHALLCVTAVLMLFGTAGCSDEKFSADPSHRLDFSVSEVAFDTLITTYSSRTKTFSIYNRNKEGIRLRRVALGKGAASPFRANVDGQYLYDGVGEDFEVLGNDSIIVRVEVTAEVTPGMDVQELTDNLLFTLESGVAQTLTLRAGVMDALFIDDLVISADTTFSSTKPIVVQSGIHVDTCATLTLAAGTTLMFHHGACMEVDGTLRILGTVEQPVVLRSDQTEHMFADLYYDNTPNRWRGVFLNSSSHDNVIQNCDLHAASNGIIAVSDSVMHPILTLENSIIHNVGGTGVSLFSGKSYIANTQISNSMGITLNIHGGWHEVVHCTLAQFYALSATRGPALYLRGQSTAPTDSLQRPHLARAHFINSVITGYGTDVIEGDLEETDEQPCDYLFRNCYLNTVESAENNRFQNVAYDTDEQPTPREKNFKRFDTDLYLYDFTPVVNSRIRQLADTLYALPFDRLGRSRTLDEAPDAGCYEYVEQ